VSRLELDTLHRVVRRDGREVRIGPTSLRILAVLIKCPDGIERGPLHERVFAHRSDGGMTDDAFSVTISALRRKLEPLGLQISQARWGLPYRLEALS